MAEYFGLTQRCAAEFTGTALLSAGIVGSGIMGERLSGGNMAIALLANSVATGGALLATILTFEGISGAHFNPVVTLSNAFLERRWRECPAYIAAQSAGAIAGVALANCMFGLPILFHSRHARAGDAMFLSEAVAAFGLVAVIRGCSRMRPNQVAMAVAAYISAGYWFTASTGFANPAITLARSATDTFAGIRPLDVPFFIAAQLTGAATAAALFRWLLPEGAPEGAKEKNAG